MLTCFQTLTFLCEKYLFINENYCFDYGYRFDHGVGSNAEGICILFSSFLFHVATRMQNSFWSFVSIIFWQNVRENKCSWFLPLPVKLPVYNLHVWKNPWESMNEWCGGDEQARKKCWKFQYYFVSTIVRIQNDNDIFGKISSQRILLSVEFPACYMMTLIMTWLSTVLSCTIFT